MRVPPVGYVARGNSYLHFLRGSATSEVLLLLNMSRGLGQDMLRGNFPVLVTLILICNYSSIHTHNIEISGEPNYAGYLNWQARWRSEFRPGFLQSVQAGDEIICEPPDTILGRKRPSTFPVVFLSQSKPWTESFQHFTVWFRFALQIVSADSLERFKTQPTTICTKRQGTNGMEELCSLASDALEVQEAL
jgi:hypothetical protein